MVLYFNKITSGLLYVSLLVLFISYTPIVYNNVWYGVCRYALYTMLGSVSVISFSWNVCLRSSILRCILVCILIIGLEFLFFYSKAFHVATCLKQPNAIGVYVSGTVFQPDFYIEIADEMKKDDNFLLYMCLFFRMLYYK